MDDRLAEQTRRILDRAGDEAARLQHEYLGSEHILIALSAEAEGPAAESLASNGVSVDRVREAVAALIGIGPPGAVPTVRGMSPRARAALGRGRDEAARRGQSSMTPAHLLIGLVGDPACVASVVLSDLGSPGSIIADDVARRLDESGPATR